jgi:hypothetical protein
MLRTNTRQEGFQKDSRVALPFCSLVISHLPLHSHYSFMEKEALGRFSSLASVSSIQLESQAPKQQKCKKKREKKGRSMEKGPFTKLEYK